jgi:hypothetical protein
MTDERYKNGKLYKLVSSLTNDVYIGSTIKTLNTRLSEHKSGYNFFIEKKGTNCRSSRLFEKGIDEVTIELIENYSCNSRSELEKRERFYIEKIINCINRCIPTRTKKEYCQANKQAILAKNKEYYHANKDTISAKAKVKITCECGQLLTKVNLARHKKSIKHTDYMAIQLTNSLTQLTI